MRDTGINTHTLIFAFAGAAIAFAVVALAEWLHTRRMQRVGRLAFGPKERPAAWARAVPFVRPVAVAGLTWSLVLLLLMAPRSHHRDGGDVSFEKLKHIVMVLDVSPSMRLQDAGPEGVDSRLLRAREVMESYFQRVPMNEFRVTVVAVYTDALPVVQDTKDIGVVRNILNDLPMHFAFVAGDTDLFSGIDEAAKIARGWRPRSTTVVLVSDGDTVPATGMPRMPASVADVLVVGIGDPQKGSFINGRNSRQDVSTLRQIAARLNGSYHNGNEHHLSTALIERLTAGMEGDSTFDLSVRELALLITAICLLTLVAIPVGLHYWGTTWQPGIRRRKVETLGTPAARSHPAGSRARDKTGLSHSVRHSDVPSTPRQSAT